MYIVLEIQYTDETHMAVVPSTTFATMNEALAKFWQTCVAMAQSNVPQHSVCILDNRGQCVKVETVFHEVEEE